MYRLRRGFGAVPSVQDIFHAIATAEGYYLPSGAVNSPSAAPVRNNNPCDLTSNGALRVFSSFTDGQNACYGQINAIQNDTSSVYSSDMSIMDIASRWAPAQGTPGCTLCQGNVPANWATTVAGQLGLSPYDTLSADSAISSPATQSPSDSASTPQDLSSVASSFTDFTSGLSLTDDSGNLSPVGWSLIAAAALGLVIAVSS